MGLVLRLDEVGLRQRPGGDEGAVLPPVDGHLAAFSYLPISV